MEEIKNKTVADLLRGCEGAELYSADNGPVTFRHISPDGDIVCEVGKDLVYYLADGRRRPDGEVMLRPGRVVRDWGCWRVKYVLPDEDDPAGWGRELKSLLEEAGGRDDGSYDSCDDPDGLYYINAEDGCLDLCFRGRPEYDYILRNGFMLKPGYMFEPFDRVLVRRDRWSIWRPTLFSYMSYKNGRRYCAIDGLPYDYCIPYDTDTARLAGTDESWEDGE